MGNKIIPDEAPPSLESFYRPWVAGIDLPHLMCCGFFVSFIDDFNIEHRDSQRVTVELSYPTYPNKEGARSCTCPYGEAQDVFCRFQIVYAINRESSPIIIKYKR